jgi:membrane fusion protein (multidrug efflux system)
MTRALVRGLAAFWLVVFSACEKAPQAAAPPPDASAPEPIEVVTAPVEVRPVPRHLTLTGSVFADRDSLVAANVSGRVTRTEVERGQRVEAGDVIAAVDSRAAGYSASAAAAALQAAETQVELAEQDCRRAEELFSKGAIARAEHDRLMIQCKAQLHHSRAARANARLASKLAGDTLIRAPFAGVVGERLVSVGEYVQPNSQVASLFAVDRVRVRISVPEVAVGRVHEGQQLEVAVAAWPDRTFPATVRYVSPALRPDTRDLILEAVADNPEGALRPGMFATVRLVVGEQPLPTVPANALRTEGPVQRLFLARDGRALELVVRTGGVLDGRVALLEPLEEGTPVIVDPPAGLGDGAAIQ